MKAVRLALRVVPAGLVLVGTLAYVRVKSYNAGLNARCATGNMGGPDTPENVKLLHDLGFSWAHRALTCKFDDYQFVMPSEPGQGDAAYVIRKGRMFLLVNEKETDLFDDSGQRFLFALTRATSERVGTISYSAYDSAKGEWIENIDLGADGTLDVRTTEVNGRRVKQEYRVGYQWLEMVQREGRPGVVFDARFMPVSDAIKLANSTKGR